MTKNKTTKLEIWNIGVVKFFDHKKGFGYIASNNCHIPRSEYVQDFYVNDSSFADGSAKGERGLVVFKGISIACEVRRYNKDSQSDRQLGIDYFFNHENFHLKETTVNIFHDLSIPREEWLPEVTTRIKLQSKRTPESTLELIKHFVGKYKKNLPGGYQHIFTKDFDSEELRPIWQLLFDELNQEEVLMVLKFFPRAAIYFSADVIDEWIDTIDVKGNISVIDDLEYIASKFDIPLKSRIKLKIRQSVDDYLIDIIKERSDSDFIYNCVNSEFPTLQSFDFKDLILPYQEYTDTDFSPNIAEANDSIKPFIDQRILEIIESWGNGEPISHANNNRSTYGHQVEVTLESLVAPYQKYTDTNFADKIDKANLDHELSDFYQSLQVLESLPIRHLEQIKEKFRPLKKYQNVVDAFSDSVMKAFVHLKGAGDIINTVTFIRGIKDVFPSLFAEYSTEIWPEIPIYIEKLITEVLNEGSLFKFQDEFEQNFNDLLSIYDDSRSTSLRQEIINAILDSQNISILTYAVNSDFKWLTADKAIAKSIEVINAKSNSDLINIVRGESDILLDKIKEHIVIRLLASFVGKSLDISYEGDGSTYYTKGENGNLLRAIKRFLPEDTQPIRQAWASYVDSLSTKDIIELYNLRIIDGLPNNVISIIIGISVCFLSSRSKGEAALFIASSLA